MYVSIPVKVVKSFTQLIDIQLDPVLRKMRLTICKA